MSLSEINKREKDFHNKLHLSEELERKNQGKFYKALYGLYSDFLNILKNETEKSMRSVIDGKPAVKSVTVGRVAFKKGQEIDGSLVANMGIKDLARVPIKAVDEKVLLELEESSKAQVQVLKSMLGEKIERLKKGDDLPPGVIKLVKVFMAMKRKLQVCDKMGGVTAIRVWFQQSFRKKICLIWRVANR